jgi:hypothetical protein
MVRRWGRLEIEQVEQKDHRLGRHKVHDERSKGFARTVTVDRSLWHDKAIRIYDPIPNPNQPVGNCTMCAKAIQLNAVGNRKTGEVLDMDWALATYRIETRNDEFAGSWEPDDTGSSGLSSAKTAVLVRKGGTYRWLFGGADDVVQAVMDGWVVSVGTWWYQGMFSPDLEGVIRPTGSRVGGHQYAARGYRKARDQVMIRCWWGPGYRDVWIARGDLNELILDGGDAHTQTHS